MLRHSEWYTIRGRVTLRQAELGILVPKVCSNMGNAEQAFYRWKELYTGMGGDEVTRVRIREEENRSNWLLVCLRAN